MNLSSTQLRLARGLKWILPGAALWAAALFFFAQRTHHFREHQRQGFVSKLVVATVGLEDDLDRVRQANSRLLQELSEVGELRATANRLQKEFAATEAEQLTRWSAQSNLLQASIEKTRREIAEITRWGSEWHKAKTLEAAQARLAEKAQESSSDLNDYSKTKEILSSIASAQKRLSEIRNEWQQLDESEKEKFRPRLKEAQDEWWAAQQALGKDSVLYQNFPVRGVTEDAATRLLMQSIIPDQNGQIVSLFLDGTVTLSKPPQITNN